MLEKRGLDSDDWLLNRSTYLHVFVLLLVVPDPTFLNGDFILQKGDRIDNDHIILTRLVSSKLGCAIHCHRNKMCQGFSLVNTQTCVMASQLTHIQGDRQLFLVYKKNKD